MVSPTLSLKTTRSWKFGRSMMGERRVQDQVVLAVGEGPTNVLAWHFFFFPHKHCFFYCLGWYHSGNSIVGAPPQNSKFKNSKFNIVCVCVCHYVVVLVHETG